MYKLEPKVLGEGAFGKVRLATSPDGHKVAVKLIKRNKLTERAETLLAREVKHHELLRHPNIVRLYTWLKTPTKYYLVMEFCPRGDLLSHLEKSGQISDAEARFLFAQLLKGVAFCHSLGIHHRDLKLENLLLVDPAGLARPAANPSAGSEQPIAPSACESDAGGGFVEYVLKIADFGLSELNPIGLSGTYCGSPLYAAPELMHQERREASPEGYDASKSDMWSCGVIFYALLTSSLPFDSDDLHTLVRMIVQGVPREPVPKARGDAAAALCTALLRPEASERLTAEEALNHEWLAPAAPERAAGGLRVAQTLAALSCVDTSDGMAAADAAEPVAVRRGHSTSGTRGLTQTTAFFKSLLAAERVEEESENAVANESSAAASNPSTCQTIPSIAPAPTPPPAAPTAPAETETVSDADDSASTTSMRKPGSAMTKADLEQIKADAERAAKAEQMKEYALRELGLAPGDGVSSEAAAAPAPDIDIDYTSTAYSVVS